MFLPYFIWDCDNHVEISSLVYDGKVLHKRTKKNHIVDLQSVLSNKVKIFGENDVLNSKWCKINALQIPHLLSDSIRQIPPVTT